MHAMSSSAARTRQMSAVAEPYDGVLSRTLLRENGADHRVVSRQVSDERWRLVGRETVATHTGPLSFTALSLACAWETASSQAAVDGVGALRLAGLKGFDVSAVDVSVPWDVRRGPISGVRIHRVCREPDDVVYAGPPRLPTPLATVRAAHWASSDRQAALLLVLPVQQRLVRPVDLLEASRCDRVRGRRELVRQLVADIADGAQSLGELDFARLCRRRGLPQPDRQAVVRTSKGRIYLDVRWTAIGLVVEIDGAGHREALSVMDDHLRQNRVTIGENLVLRYDLFALRLHPNEVLDQVCDAYTVASGRRAS